MLSPIESMITHLAHPRLVDPLQRRAALAANQRVAIAAHRRVGDWLGAGGAVELGGGLVGFCHRVIIGPAGPTPAILHYKCKIASAAGRPCPLVPTSPPPSNPPGSSCSSRPAFPSPSLSWRRTSPGSSGRSACRPPCRRIGRTSRHPSHMR